MRKIFSVLLAGAFFAASFGVSAEAHEFWVNAEYKDGLLKADLGYGHEYPDPEPIAADRTHLFEPLKLITAEGGRRWPRPAPTTSTTRRRPT